GRPHGRLPAAGGGELTPRVCGSAQGASDVPGRGSDRIRRVPEAVLEVRGLVKRYGAVEALKGIDLTIEKGSIYGFIGPNGAGKTTTIRIVAGLVRPTAGSVRLHGVDL